MSEIVVDTREDPRYLKMFRSWFGEDVKTATLEVGDYQFTGETTYVVEHKEAGDLLNSIRDGRIFDQTENLVGVREEGGIPLIFVSNTREMGKKMRFRHVTKRQLLGSMLWIAEKGVGVMEAWNERDLKFLYLRLWAKAKGDGSSTMKRQIYRSKVKTATIEDQAIAMLCAVNGIGPMGAKKALAGTPLYEVVWESANGSKIAGLRKKPEALLKEVVTYRMEDEKDEKG